MSFSYDTFSTPLGDFSAAMDADGGVIATAFGGMEELVGRLGPLVANEQLRREPSRLEEVRREVAEYFDQRRTRFTVLLRASGTAFQKSVWAALLELPFGTTCSYGELAGRLGKPGASRAVGKANGRNPICLLIPCHRVIGGNGSLTGFAFGNELKRRLLEHEAGESQVALF